MRAAWKAPFERVAEGLAYVPQGRMIFPALTVEENIKTGLRPGKGGIPAEIYDFFPVLGEMKRRRGGNLSGGQQQQLAIARALASGPRVLLLDEPTEGIQPSIIKELAQILKRIRDQRGLTIVVSEQVLSFAIEIADRLLVLDRGRVIQESRRGEVDRETVGRLLSI
jgi:urea transport system ATP-binding protein